MKRNSLTFGAKINCTFAALAAVLALTIWSGFHTAGMLQELLENATTRTARRIELAGALNTAKSDMAAGQRGAILFTYAKDAGQANAARTLFQESSAAFRKAFAEFGPLIVTEEGRQLAARMDSDMSAWLSDFAELEHLVDAGDSEGATRLLLAKLKPHYVALGEDCAKGIEIDNRLLTADRGAAAGEISAGRWIMLLLAALGSAVTAVALWIVRGANSTLRQSATELLEGSRQVAAAAGQEI